MTISQSTYEQLLDILRICFDLNARSDSIAYCLDYFYYNKLAKLYHHSWAHFFPQLADIVSDEMLKHNALPKRLAVKEYSYDNEDFFNLFNLNLEGILELKRAIRSGIEIADMNNDIEIRIFLENLLQDVETHYEKQAYEWLNAAKVLSKSDFNIHVEDYTNFITKVE